MAASDRVSNMTPKKTTATSITSSPPEKRPAFMPLPIPFPRGGFTSRDREPVRGLSRATGLSRRKAPDERPLTFHIAMRGDSLHGERRGRTRGGRLGEASPSSHPQDEVCPAPGGTLLLLPNTRQRRRHRRVRSSAAGHTSPAAERERGVDERPASALRPVGATWRSVPGRRSQGGPTQG
jgi:hypothetical protein